MGAFKNPQWLLSLESFCVERIRPRAAAEHLAQNGHRRKSEWNQVKEVHVNSKNIVSHTLLTTSVPCPKNRFFCLHCFFDFLPTGKSILNLQRCEAFEEMPPSRVRAYIFIWQLTAEVVEMSMRPSEVHWLKTAANLPTVSSSAWQVL